MKKPADSNPKTREQILQGLQQTHSSVKGSPGKPDLFLTVGLVIVAAVVLFAIFRHLQMRKAEAKQSNRKR